MKHQYVGDINDYVEYGLLRVLTARGQIASAVAWLLTADDLSRDGRKLGYLEAPAVWRSRDPELYDALAGLVARGERSVEAVAAAGLLPGTRFHAELVPRSREARRAHFARTLEIAAESELLFFDPDNGLEVGSFPAGRKGCEKYLLWDELTEAYAAGHSVLVYQHFPRRERGAYVLEMSARIGDRTGACEVFACRTANVAFFLAVQHGATEWYAERMGDLNAAWAGIIESEMVAVA